MIYRIFNRAEVIFAHIGFYWGLPFYGLAWLCGRAKWL